MTGPYVHVNVKHVRINGVRAYQNTALDDGTRLRVLGLSPTLGVRPTLAFLAEVRRRFPFPIRKIQTDLRGRVRPRVRSGRGGGGHPPPLHSPRRPQAEREGAAQPPDRSRGVLEPAPGPRLHRGGRRPSAPRGAGLWPGRRTAATRYCVGSALNVNVATSGREHAVA